MTRICKQPNGKYCIYSTVIDMPMCINMTIDDFYKNTTKETQRQFDLSDFENAPTLQSIYKKRYNLEEITADDFDMSEERFAETMRKMSDENGVFEKLYTRTEW